MHLGGSPALFEVCAQCDGLVVPLIPSRIDQRNGAVLLFQFFHFVCQCLLLPQFTAITPLKFHLTFRVVRKPFPEGIRRRNLFQPEIDSGFLF